MSSTEKKSGYPSGLSASCWSVLVHYFWCPEDWSHEHAEKQITELVAAGLLQRRVLAVPSIPAIFQLTKRGEFLARHVVNLPLPVEAWEMPNG